MRFQRLGPAGAERPYVRSAGRLFELDRLAPDIDPAFFAADGIARTAAALAAGELPEAAAETADLRVGPPVGRPPAIVCIGQNYAAHAAESGAAPPEHPIVFFKHPNTLVGPYDDILLPPGAERVDWEVELAVVIGRRARYLDTDAEAEACIAGFAVSDDVSERAWQLEVSGGQWSKGKSAETFNPLGPELVTPDEVDCTRLRLRSWVDDEPRQDSTTADLIFGVAALVRDLSQYLVLEPGDIINTGTPQGVALSGRFPYLVEGNTVRVAIDGLGEQRSRVRRATR
ncbi:fumarylacetoacetate hydrolase family protein [Leifsonia sp. ZF2019]|uniref:fumarylacetoacetate hydrolase family protein n=1 Tax=Leifsonia sp. ZF2019 TaxID=2781978 RepID=UPI001CBF8717|nr:fumarylacetoacetate hydrolase family protein [Leifsonia sp. ZF2019]UAJ81067.1 fumarylacetoacetate hydrolase family protein [Leifsonia sp. ZF2019]